LLTTDAQLASRGYWQLVDHPEVGETVFTSPPFRIDGERVELSRPPLFGEHTNQVLSDVLGLPASQIEALAAEGVFQ
jgi:benzylsuccinate CoA-transferase BbsF subunit